MFYSPSGRGGPPGGGYGAYDPYGYYREEFYQPPGGGGLEDQSGFSSDQSLVAYPPIRPSQPSRGGGFGSSKHVIRMRGLPFQAKEMEIMDFFSPVVPTKVNIDFDHYGRPSGEAEVVFSSHKDAFAAMDKNNAHMGELGWFSPLPPVHIFVSLSGHRYIELFLNSKEDLSAGNGPPTAGVAPSVPPGTRFLPPQQPSWSDPRSQVNLQ